MTRKFLRAVPAVVRRAETSDDGQLWVAADAARLGTRVSNDQPDKDCHEQAQSPAEP